MVFKWIKLEEYDLESMWGLIAQSLKHEMNMYNIILYEINKLFIML